MNAPYPYKEMDRQAAMVRKENLARISTLLSSLGVDCLNVEYEHRYWEDGGPSGFTVKSIRMRNGAVHIGDSTQEEAISGKAQRILNATLEIFDIHPEQVDGSWVVTTYRRTQSLQFALDELEVLSEGFMKEHGTSESYDDSDSDEKDRGAAWKGFAQIDAGLNVKATDRSGEPIPAPANRGYRHRFCL